MASTYSDRLKLELMEAGANAGIWGNNTNDNLQVIDAAVGGYLSKNVAGSSDVTLSQANRDPDVETTNESGNKIIELTGTLTGNIYVYVPAVEKEYTFYNNTSGSYTLTVAPTGHTANGVAITQGDHAIIYNKNGNRMVNTFSSLGSGTVTSVTVAAGNGLTGGGTITTTGTATLDVGAGTGIDVTADAIAVDVSDFMTNGSNNRVVTATGTDAMNAEANMTFDGSTLSVTGAASISGTVTGGTFSGSGASLTALNASNISSGTLSQSRLQNDSITINGTSVALGASTTISSGLTLIQTQTVSSGGVSSVTFSSGLSSYTQFIITGNFGTGGQGNSFRVGLYKGGSLSIQGDVASGNGNENEDWGYFKCFLSSQKYAYCVYQSLVNGDGGSGYTYQDGGFGATGGNTSDAFSSIVVSCSASDMKTGSTFRLYGVTNA